MKEWGGWKERLMQYCAEMMMSMSTCDDFEQLLNLSGMTGAEIAMREKEYSIGTCDTDMLMESYHHFFDDIVIVDAAVHTCALDVAAEVLKDWLINLPLN